MQHPICIFGEVLFDCFPDGREVLGGAPFNVAWHLQAFRQSPVFVSSVGDDDAGRHISEAMEGWGMSLDGLQVDSGHPTGRVSVSLEGGEPSYEIVADSAYDFIASDALPEVDAGLIYHGSLALRNKASKEALRTLKSQAAGAPVFVDVNLRAPWWQRDSVLELLNDADWAKLNGDELALLGDGGADEIASAERFRTTHGLHGLVLTRGAAGALALEEGGEPVEVRPGPVAEVVDAVGAGDAFASILILGIRLGWPLAATLERAQDFASELVQRRGATVSDPGFYRAFAEQWGLTSG
jgi:fructokinase